MKFTRRLSFFTFALLTAALISQGSAASSSWVTWGFSVGASAELSGTTSKDSSKSSNSVASNLSGKNIKILTDSNKDTAINIKGSNLYASNDIYLNTHNLFMDASQDSYEAKQSSKTVSGRVSATMYGGGGGSAGLDYSKSNMKEESLSHNNAKVYAGHNIYALASNDALIKGANLRADNALALKVGHDLSLASLRDSYNYDSKSSSIAAGIGISGSKTNSGSNNPFAISNNMVSYSNSKLSSINANYSRSKSSTMVKQTVLSSITAKELNIEVGSNTDLKGSLIAAGYYDENGNFIDNGKLRLKTNTLTFSNLSNTRYDKSNSLSIGTNYAFKDPQQEGGGGSKDGGSQAKESTAISNAYSSNQMSGMQTSSTDMSAGKDSRSAQSKKNDTDPKSKISSINYANNRNLSYSMSKSLATIGKGELIVGDKDISSLSKDELASLQSDPNNKALYNSDDLTRLNRDSSKLSKELYSTKLNSNVDASVDMRLFSEGGRKEIKDELNRGSAITKSLEMLIKTGDLSFNENVAEYANAYELSKAYGKDLSSVLMDEKVGINTKEQVIKSLIDAYAKANGLSLEGIKVKLISDANVKGKNGNPFKGNFDSLSKTITLNLANTSDIKTFAQTLGHELSHAIDYKKGRFIPGGEAMNRYADIKGDHFADYLERGLDITGSKINLQDKLPSYDKYNKINRALLEHNLKNFNSTDKRLSDNADINLFNKNLEPWRYRAGEWHRSGILDREDIITFSAHGVIGAVYDVRKDENFPVGMAKILSAEDVANMIRSHRKWIRANGGDIKYIRLDVCYSGLGEKANNENSIAQQVANILKVPVYGTTGEYLYNEHIPFINMPDFGASSKRYDPK